MNEVYKLFISILVLFLSIEVYSKETFTVPVISDENDDYISLYFEYEKIKNESLPDKLFIDAVYKLRDAIVANNNIVIIDSYYEEDGSRKEAKRKLESGQTASFEMHQRLKKAEYNYLIRWGDYSMVSGTYDIAGAGAGVFLWREDFVCKPNRCFISTRVSADTRNQIFEVAYLNFVNYLKNKKVNKKSDYARNKSRDLILHSRVELLPAGAAFSSIDSTLSNPLIVDINIKKYRHKLCLDCKGENGLDESLGIQNALLKIKKVYETKGVEGIVNWINSYDKSFTKNMVIQKIRWKKGMPTVVQMNNEAYFKELMESKVLNILGYMRTQEYLYVFINEENINKRASIASGKSAEGKEFNIMIFKMEDEKPRKPWFTPINDYSDNVLYTKEVLQAIYKLLND